MELGSSIVQAETQDSFYSLRLISFSIQLESFPPLFMEAFLFLEDTITFIFFLQNSVHSGRIEENLINTSKTR